MKLDLSSLQKAIASLDEALKAHSVEPKNKFILDSCIQRFEYTYELCWKMLKRYLDTTEANPGDIDSMSFPDLIRTGSEKGLLLNGWDKWKSYREARSITSHTYDEKKAAQVFAEIPGFLKEAEYLFQQIHQRQTGR